jgi:transcription antitermination factor NusG
MKRVQASVFPGYVFCRIELPERIRVCNTPGVQYLVGMGRGPEAIQEHVIASLQKAFSEDHRVSQIPYLKTGELVQVVDGPLFGTVGTLLRVKGQVRLVLSVDILERSLAVEVDAASVVPLSRSNDKHYLPWASSPVHQPLS